jgi:hypothetical protein
VGPHGDPSLIFLHHGQPEKETSSENEQAQAPEALEVESPQEAYVAEVSCVQTHTARNFSQSEARRLSRRAFCRVKKFVLRCRPSAGRIGCRRIMIRSRDRPLHVILSSIRIAGVVNADSRNLQVRWGASPHRPPQF